MRPTNREFVVAEVDQREIAAWENLVQHMAGFFAQRAAAEQANDPTLGLIDQSRLGRSGQDQLTIQRWWLAH